ncbi:hypothetical protein RchiOBHm_Chr2g0159361 [Rosa chinensis]|uniref:Uncharacterized protein n=1 Tax=Rosa chinensis TaxID=74649 RepID=A0A2P6S281_ROSCH|nr:hypothetical protein RchiOBHm_Chr2g0159361 [Rosa chinensis]
MKKFKFIVTALINDEIDEASAIIKGNKQRNYLVRHGRTSSSTKIMTIQIYYHQKFSE